MKRKSGSIILATFLGLVMTSCFTQVPLTKSPSNNNNTYNVAYLFEHDGCKVYRFYDRGLYHYFVNCNGNATVMSSDSTQTHITTTIAQKE